TAQEYQYVEFSLLTLGVVPFSPPPKTTILQNAQITSLRITSQSIDRSWYSGGMEREKRGE
ncbi:hypothetical protein, partial [Alicyclobacillus suci]|uniref:hypothetical protein n=1 Tax=Alicyclobacillus suci TaxID=2816080 RepID=UPI001A8D258C